jgi:ureidoglycolate dehydrogenase (NAD+)
MYPMARLKRVCFNILIGIGVRADVSHEVTNCLIETSLRGVDSHGINLLPHYINAVMAGRINPNPDFKFRKTSATSGILDADHSFGHAAGSLAMKKAIMMSERFGSGFVTVYNSSHFSACSYYSLQAARKDMIGIAATHTDSLMLSARGKRAFLGTNPISFTFPCEGEEPVCLDMATTQVTWNHVKKASQSGQRLRYGVAVDKEGRTTDDPDKAAMLLPMGDYKGYALGFVVEILCGLLANAAYGPDIVSMYRDSISRKRKIAHFFGAINIDNFISAKVFKKRLKEMVSRMRSEPPADPALPVLVPGDPEKTAQEIRMKNGIPLTEETVRGINKFIIEKGFSKKLLL